MKRKIRSFGVFLTLGLLAFLSMASHPVTPLLQATETPGPRGRAALAVEVQAGSSDGVVILGILLFVFIAIPILLRYRELKNSQDA